VQENTSMMTRVRLTKGGRRVFTTEGGFPRDAQGGICKKGKSVGNIAGENVNKRGERTDVEKNELRGG